MKRTRRNLAASFKAKVALAAVTGEQALAELSQQFDFHVNQITYWKSQLQERAEPKRPSAKGLHVMIG